MDDDDSMAIGRILDFDMAGLDDVQVDIRLAGVKDGLTVGIIADSCQRSDLREFGLGQLGKRDFFLVNHFRDPRCGNESTWRPTIIPEAATEEGFRLKSVAV